MEVDSLSSIDDAFDSLKELATAGPPGLEERRGLLKSLRAAVLSNSEALKSAVYDDFQKSGVEAELTEIAPVLLETNTALSSLAGWMKPKRIPARFPLWSTKSEVVAQPKGVVLIISPWNYPILLTLTPLISAIAAGNRVVIKPSERTPHTSAFLSDLVAESIGPDWCKVIQGGPDIGAHLLSKPFDHFFFTASSSIGQIVRRAAGEHMSSVTLELGGKSPAIVHRTADIALAAEKIVIGKFLNAGQTCIAPDYVLANNEHYDEIVDAISAQAQRFHRGSPEASPITGIVDQAHAERLRELWDDARARGATKPNGSELDLSTVSVITRVPIASRLMQEEIFGPLLPVLRFSTLDDVIGLVAETGAPLTSYLFTRDDKFVVEFSRRIKTGSICVNETLLHFAHPGLPFGGVAESGQGRTHGHAGFQAFSDDLSIHARRAQTRANLSRLLPS